MWTFEYMNSPYREEWQRDKRQWDSKETAATCAAYFMTDNADIRVAVRLKEIHQAGE